jgi:hypothetical protein
MLIGLGAPDGHPATAHVSQSILTPGRSYRVTGWHKSDLTGGFVPIMDCDHDGHGGIRSPVPPAEQLGHRYADFDDLAVTEETPLRVECRNKQLEPLGDLGPESDPLEDADMEAAGVAPWEVRD